MANSRNYSNTAVSTTLNGSITNVGTNVVLTSQTGMPATPFLLCIEPDTANEELVLVTSGSGTVGVPYVVTRGQDGTTNIGHSSLVTVQHRIAAVDFTDSRTHEASSAGVHGLNGANISANGGTSSITSNITVTNTLTETTCSKVFQIPGNTLVAGSAYRVTAFGTLACTATPTLQFKLKYDTNVLATFTITFSSAAATDFRIVGEFIAQTAGASANLAGALTLWSPFANTAATFTNDNPTDTAGLLTAISTTTAKNLNITATWGTQSSSNTVTVLGSVVEQLF